MADGVSRRRFLGSGLAAAALSGLGGRRAAGAAGPPNILFLLADDQRHDLLGCAGHPHLRTPHLDALAARGTRFVNASVTTSICAASRATLLTGLTERSHGFTFGTPPLASQWSAVSYPTQLRAAGYRTGLIGKLGVGIPAPDRAAMFDVFQPIDRNPYHKLQPDGSRRHTTELTADAAVEFLAEQPAGQPFCLSVSFNAPHAEDSDKAQQYHWPAGVDGWYDDVTIPPPALGEPEVFAAHPPFLRESLNRERWHWRFDTPEKYQFSVRGYYRMISGVDQAVGRIVAALERHGLVDRTVVVYAADNGYFLGERGFAGKWLHYQESLRIPLLIADPRVDAAARGRVSEALALNLDLPATFLDLAGRAAPAAYQGVSLVGELTGGGPRLARTDFFCEHRMEHQGIPKWEGVHGQRWVYANYYEQESGEFLHDLDRDPRQLVNLAGDPACAGVLERLRSRTRGLSESYLSPT